MHRSWSDPAANDQSVIHRLPAGLKLAAAVGITIVVVAIPVRHPVHLIWPSILLLLIALASRIDARFILKRLALFEPLVISASILSIFQPDGWRIFAVLVAKCTLCLLTAILLSATTPFNEIIEVLRRVRVPSLLVTTLALMHRYLFVLVDESHRMRRARTSRTLVAPRRARQWRSLATVAGQLFVRASERAERVYSAMCARGWR